MHLRFDKMDEFIIVYDGTRYLTLFSSEIYDAIYDKVRYLKMSKKWHHIYFSHSFAKIKVGFLPIEKIYF